MVGDCRLSNRGVAIREDATKLKLALPSAARLVVGYTGLAKCGTFDADDWLGTALQQAMQTRGFDSDALVQLSDQRFAALPPACPRNFTVLTIGFVQLPNGTVEHFVGSLSNFQDLFGLTLPRVPQGPGFGWAGGSVNRIVHPRHSFTVAAGSFDLLEAHVYKHLLEMTQNDKPPQDVANFAVGAIRDSATRPGHGARIGRNCQALFITSEEGAAAQYEPYPDSHPATALPPVEKITPTTRTLAY
jgi:hypothetical protein